MYDKNKTTNVKPIFFIQNKTKIIGLSKDSMSPQKTFTRESFIRQPYF